MKLLEVVKICKKAGKIELARNGCDRWLGDGRAIYLVPEFLDIGRDNIFAVFDFTEKERENVSYVIRKGMDTGIDFSDYCDSESDAEPMLVRISIGGTVFVPIKTDKGVVFVRAEYLRPFKDTTYTMSKREIKDGTPYIVIKEGMIVTAVIMPCKLDGYGVKDELKEIARSMWCGR